MYGYKVLRPELHARITVAEPTRWEKICAGARRAASLSYDAFLFALAWTLLAYSLR